MIGVPVQARYGGNIGWGFFIDGPLTLWTYLVLSGNQTWQWKIHESPLEMGVSTGKSPLKSVSSIAMFDYRRGTMVIYFSLKLFTQRHHIPGLFRPRCFAVPRLLKLASAAMYIGWDAVLDQLWFCVPTTACSKTEDALHGILKMMYPEIARRCQDVFEFCPHWCVTWSMTNLSDAN